MNKLFQILLTALLLSSCSYKITRHGYQEGNSNYPPCDIVIQKNTTIPDSIAYKVGEVELKDTGFTIVCNEVEAINILKEDACSLQANLIVITEERRPNMWSSCYRCKAEFYQITSSDFALMEDKYSVYHSEEISKRVTKDRGKNTSAFILSCITGAVLVWYIATSL
ncbi:hypothetical protein [Reichenbachiella ulvae]|uniref:Lipoprotein n=1 Tax=Reichenbachiella ulvae TaxID=2980104 RepID=A0ABT3CT90_9BACT|nr:hypothetical protein [Reichenbachiella ulvae]MCV9386852.1 hypothetical protein [Reichenbachiella ulvae]